MSGVFSLIAFQKTDGEAVFAAAYFRIQQGRGIYLYLDQLHFALGIEILLVQALECCLLLEYAAAAQQSQEQLRGFLYGADFVAPVIQLHDSFRVRQVEPVVKLGKVEFVAATGDGPALGDAFQKIVLSQCSAQLPAAGVEAVDHVGNVIQYLMQSHLVHFRVGADGRQGFLLLLQLLEHVFLYVSPGEYAADIQQRLQGRPALPLTAAGKLKLELLEQMGNPQQGTRPFIEWMFKKNLVVQNRHPASDNGCCIVLQMRWRFNLKGSRWTGKICVAFPPVVVAVVNYRCFQ